jgi:hypothetical protein
LAAGDPVSPSLRVDALFTAAALAQVQGDFPRAIALSEEGIALARAHRYPFGEARAHIGLGITAEWQGDLGQAEGHYERAQTLMRQVAESDRLAHWTVLPVANLADLALLRGDTARAMALA